MNEILKIYQDVILVRNSNGKIIEINAKSLTFTPHIGDRVFFIEKNGETIVSNVFELGSEDSEVVNTGVDHKDSKKMLVNKNTYCLLIFFFGGFGFHKFYGHKVMEGVLYFMFWWTLIPSVLSLVEIVDVLLKDADADGNVLV